MSQPLPQPGDVVNDRYQILAPLGKGGMGQVFSVRDRKTGHDVALKYLIVPPDKPQALDRFKTEFSRLVEFPHPNISAVYDFATDSARGLSFFTSEWIQGRTFLEATRGMTPLPIEELVVQTLRALEYLHSHKLVHFDIKPPNVLITTAADGTLCAKVIDFGVADYGFAGRLVGTPGYMAPEMTRRAVPDHRADLYSLGVMWYQVLLGLPGSPFRGANRDETFYRHQTWLPQVPSSLNPAIPHYMDDIVMRLLEKNPEDRFPYAAAVIAEINLHKDMRGEPRYEIETRETRESYLPTESRFVGRELALGIVRQFLHDHKPSDDSTTVANDILSVTGEAGMGKSRLLAEAKHLAQLNGFLTIEISADSAVGWDETRRALELAMETPATPTVVFLDDYLRLKSIPAAAPLVEILQRFEESLISMRQLSTTPVYSCMMVVGDSIGGATIQLKPFDDRELSEYVRVVSGFEDPPRGFVDELMRYTEGNPYFVTELMRALIAQGILLDSQGRWKATTFEDLGVDFDAVKIPVTLKDRISLDYNHLSSPEQEVVAALSVWGGAARLDQLEAVIGSADSRIVSGLVHKGWAELDLHDHTLAIPNPSRRQAVEAIQTPAHRSRLHTQIADVLQKDPASSPEWIHYHLAHGENPALVADSLWTLANHYIETARPLAAIELLHRLYDTPDARERFKVGLMLGRTYRSVRQYEASQSIFLDLEKRLQNGNEAYLAELWEEMAITANKKEDFDAAENYCMKSLQLIAHHVHDPVRKLRVENYLAQVFLAKGAVDRAVETFHRTLEEADHLPMEQRSRIINNDICHALFQNGDYVGVLTQAEKDILFFEEVGNVRQYLRINRLKGEALRYLRRYKEADAAYQHGIQYAQKRHDLEHLFFHYLGQGNSMGDQGRMEEAIAHFQRALDLTGRLGKRNLATQIMTNMGILYSKSDNKREAVRSFQKVVEYMKTQPPATALEQLYHCRAHLELAELYRGSGEHAMGRQHLDEAEKLATTHANCGPLLFYVALTRAELHRDMGDNKGAKALLYKLKQSTTDANLLKQIEITETTIDDASD